MDLPRPAREARSALAEPLDSASALALAEMAKCRDLRGRLLLAGARPHALTDLASVSLPNLRPDEALLSFRDEPAGGRVRRFWLRGGGAAARELPSRDRQKLTALVARARDELELGERLRGSELSSLLARSRVALLEGAELSTVRRLLVIPDGITRALPVHVLAPDLEVAYLPCLGLLRPFAPSTWSGAVLTPAYGGERKPLPGAAEEVTAARAWLSRALVASLGPSVTPALLEQSLASRLALVHFAGHGVAADAGPGRGLLPELVFPDGARSANAATLTARPVRTSLVTLASCATAEVARFRDGKQQLAEITLPEALLAAGAQRVLAASWAVKDRQSARQLEVFYRHLHALGPAAALNRAQREARAAIKPSHPRFWAFYAIYGGF